MNANHAQSQGNLDIAFPHYRKTAKATARINHAKKTGWVKQKKHYLSLARKSFKNQENI